MSPADSRDLERAFRDRREKADLGEECPDHERIWSAVSGELTREETIGIVKHTGRCPACAGAWRLARSMGATGEDEESVGSGSGSERAGWRWLPLAAAATALLVIGVGFVFLKRESRAPVFRSGEPESIRSLISQDEPVSPSALRLRWSPGPEGTLYNVQVTTEDLSPLASAGGLDEAEYLVPREALGGLAPGTRLLWQVDAFLPDGRRVTSDTFFVTLEGEP